MPRAQSMDVINDSTTMTSRIDTMLMGVREDWDSSPEIKWNPGDPLYDHPSDTAYVYDEGNPEWNAAVSGGTQCTRQMIELFDDGDRYEAMRCVDCQVTWDWYNDDPCWVCGKAVKGYEKPEYPTFRGYESQMRMYEAAFWPVRPARREEAPPRVERRDEFTITSTYDIDFNRYRVEGRYLDRRCGSNVEAEELINNPGVVERLVRLFGREMRVPNEVLHCAMDTIQTSQSDGIYTTRATDPWLRFGYMSPMTVYRQQRVGVVDSVEEDDRGLIVRGTMDTPMSPVVAWIQREMRMMLSLEVQTGSYAMLQQILWGDGSGGIERYDPPAEDVDCWYRANRSETLDGIRANRVVMDEWLPITEPVVTNGIVIPDEIPTAKPIAPPVIKSKTFATNADRQNLEELSQEPLTIGSIPVTSSRRNYNA